MRRLKRFAQIDIGYDEGLYETTQDRWSKHAKHRIPKSQLREPLLIEKFETGDVVLLDGKQAIVEIPVGPRNTVGIRMDGKLKMVHESKIQTKIEEGVMGGVLAMPAINRMMQLAGLEHTGGTTPVSIEEERLLEDASDDMLSRLVDQAARQPQFQGNEEAARLYTIGALLATIGKSVDAVPPQTVTGQSKMQSLKTLGVMGADLIKTADDMTKPKQAPATTPGVTT